MLRDQCSLVEPAQCHIVSIEMLAFMADFLFNIQQNMFMIAKHVKTYFAIIKQVYAVNLYSHKIDFAVAKQVM